MDRPTQLGFSLRVSVPILAEVVPIIPKISGQGDSYRRLRPEQDGSESVQTPCVDDSEETVCQGRIKAKESTRRVCGSEIVYQPLSRKALRDQTRLVLMRPALR